MADRRDVWDLHNRLKEELGDELFLEEICKGLSVDEAMDLYEYIARNHDIDYREEDEEDDDKTLNTPMGFCIFGEGAEDMQKAMDALFDFMKRTKG